MGTGQSLVRVGVIDSGINPAHPHLAGGGAIRGAGIGLYQNTEGDFLDSLGHGTAVAAAIRSHCPSAELYIAKVFDKTLNTRAEVILRAIEWCVSQGVHCINLSLGTHNPSHREAFEQWALKVTFITASGSLPGGIPNVITISEDTALKRAEWRRTGPFAFAASGRPRPIPGRSEEENLGGVSFAVANFTGLAAQAMSLNRPTPWEPAYPSSDC